MCGWQQSGWHINEKKRGCGHPTNGQTIRILSLFYISGMYDFTCFYFAFANGEA